MTPCVGDENNELTDCTELVLTLCCCVLTCFWAASVSVLMLIVSMSALAEWGRIKTLLTGRGGAVALFYWGHMRGAMSLILYLLYCLLLFPEF